MGTGLGFMSSAVRSLWQALNRVILGFPLPLWFSSVVRVDTVPAKWKQGDQSALPTASSSGSEPDTAVPETLLLVLCLLTWVRASSLSSAENTEAL